MKKSKIRVINKNIDANCPNFLTYIIIILFSSFFLGIFAMLIISNEISHHHFYLNSSNNKNNYKVSNKFELKLKQLEYDVKKTIYNIEKYSKNKLMKESIIENSHNKDDISNITSDNISSRFLDYIPPKKDFQYKLKSHSTLLDMAIDRINKKGKYVIYNNKYNSISTTGTYYKYNNNISVSYNEDCR